ncbi:hypothetical protein B484DRAFT_336870, partial [Ochromonadaceae sp. CCMP2298]
TYTHTNINTHLNIHAHYTRSSHLSHTHAQTHAKEIPEEKRVVCKKTVALSVESEFQTTKVRLHQRFSIGPSDTRPYTHPHTSYHRICSPN